GALVLADLDGEDHVVGGEVFAVAPLDALAELQLVGLVVDPLAALRKPGDVFSSLRLVEEQGLVDQTHRSGGVVTRVERVPRARRPPLGTTGVEGLRTGVVPCRSTVALCVTPAGCGQQADQCEGDQKPVAVSHRSSSLLHLLPTRGPATVVWERSQTKAPRSLSSGHAGFCQQMRLLLSPPARSATQITDGSERK